MRRIALFFLLFLSAVTPALGRKHGPQVTVSTDRFTNETTVRLETFTLGDFKGGYKNNGWLQLTASASFPNNQGIFMGLVCHAQDWQFLNGVVAHVLADGERIDLNFQRGSTKVEENAWTLEILGTLPFIDRPTFDKMANAKVLEMEIGPYAFTFKPAGIQFLKDFSNALGPSAPQISSPAAVPAPASQALPEGLIANSEAAKGSPAQAAALANVGHVQSPQELAELVQRGQASRCAVVTMPSGAEVYVDGNRLGLSPVAFVLLKQGEVPRRIAIKMAGYKTVEKSFLPDGKTIPISFTLEKESVNSTP